MGLVIAGFYLAVATCQQCFTCDGVRGGLTLRQNVTLTVALIIRISTYSIYQLNDSSIYRIPMYPCLIVECTAA